MECLRAVGSDGGGFPGSLSDNLKIQSTGRYDSAPNVRGLEKESLLLLDGNVPDHVVVQVRGVFGNCNPLWPLCIRLLAPSFPEQHPGDLHIEQIDSLTAPVGFERRQVEIGNRVKAPWHALEHLAESGLIFSPQSEQGNDFGFVILYLGHWTAHESGDRHGNCGVPCEFWFCVRHMFSVEDI
jgi:hypothetical protein